MKKTTTFLIISSLAACASAADNSYLTQARIIDYRPIIETVYEEIEVCYYKNKTTKQIGDKTKDKLIGGLIGGAAGSAVGKGSGRDVAAGLGAILGGEVAAQDGELTGGELIGGLAGGLLGNQLGKGKGKTAATAAGALLGTIIGDNLQNGQEVTESRTKKVKVCQIEEEPKKVITGYKVNFEHAGFQFTDVLKRRPNSEYLDINVNVDIVEDYTTSGIE